MKRIILTGGGTAGHVTPNMALIPRLQEADFEIFYVGSYDGIERKLIEEMKIPYYGISSGMLRRYFTLKTVKEPFRVMKGCREAAHIFKMLKPDVVFSKGGFVAVPVVWEARQHHVPAIIHESDLTPGLANKLSIPCATKVCCNFPETLKYLPEDKAVLTGSPIREELFRGDAAAAMSLCGFTADKPVLLVIGGSLGSVAVNEAVRKCLPTLLEQFQIIHICGKGHIDESLNGLSGYRQFDYVKKELANLLSLSDLMISRAGANAICEILALRKPNILIPLSKAASRGDQILNANSFKQQGFSRVIEEEDLTPELLAETVKEVYRDRRTYIDTMQASEMSDAISIIMGLLKEAAG